MKQMYKPTEIQSFFSWSLIDRTYQRPNCIFNVIAEWYSLLIKKSLHITVSRILLFLNFLQRLLKKNAFF